jgi:hypothetical protein
MQTKKTETTSEGLPPHKVLAYVHGAFAQFISDLTHDEFVRILPGLIAMHSTTDLYHHFVDYTNDLSIQMVDEGQELTPIMNKASAAYHRLKEQGKA